MLCKRMDPTNLYGSDFYVFHIRTDYFIRVTYYLWVSVQVVHCYSDSRLDRSLQTLAAVDVF